MRKQEALKRLDSLENEAKELRIIIDYEEEWIKLWGDFCKENKINSEDVLPFQNPKNSKQEAINAGAMIFEIVEHSNNDASFPDWKNGNQKKWFPWFDMSSGFGFSLTFYVTGARVRTSALALLIKQVINAKRL